MSLEGEMNTTESETNFSEVETLAHAIGDKGAQVCRRSKKSQLQQWLNELWDSIKNAVGLRNISNAYQGNYEGFN